MHTSRNNPHTAWLTCWVKLDKLHILIGKACSCHHGSTITRTSVSRGAREIGPAISTELERKYQHQLSSENTSHDITLPRGQHCVLSPESVYCSILKAKCHDTSTLTTFHDQVKGKVLNEVMAVVFE